MIRLRRVNQKNAEEIIDDVKSGKIHIVCMARNGLTHLNVYAVLFCKLPNELVSKCAEDVNLNKETGTLFPKANITILPISENDTTWNQKPQTLSYNELEKCIDDVFKANQEYLKSEIIYFTLEEFWVDKKSAFRIIRDKIRQIRQFKSNDLFVKTIWFD